MKEKSFKFAVLGECMIELSHLDTKTLAMNFSGDAFNTALYLARYQREAGISVDFITALGDDPYSQMMLTSWQQEGIGVQHVQKLSGKMPGVYFIRTDAKGERSFHYYRSQSAAKELFYIPNINELIHQLIHYHYIYFSGISLAILDTASQKKLLQLLDDARKQGAKICFDINYRAKLWPDITVARQVIQQVYQYVDIALPTWDDEKLLFNYLNPEDCIEQLRAWGVKEIALKLGERGCIVADEKNYDYVPIEEKVKIVDTTAAGDSFNAAYLAARIKGFTQQQAAKFANRLAGIVIGYQGAIIPITAMPKLFA